MVNTRSTVRREQEMSKHMEASTSQPSTRQPNIQTAEESENMLIKKENLRRNQDNTALLPEMGKKTATPIDLPASRKSESKKSTSSSVKARKARLELLAAEAKAKIQMELIDKRLATDLADLEDEQSERQENYSHSTVDRWLERSQQELEKVQPVNEHGNNFDELHHPGSVHPGTSDGTVQMLASALRDLAASSNNSNSNAKLLSRLSTPRDLPAFSGDPMEWLQFKQAYEESTEVCNFTPKENLWRIRKCLRGPARDAVAALLISATDPEKIMATLELRFGNPDGIVIRIMQDIKKLHPMSQDYQKDIISFSVKVQNCIEAIRSVKRDEYLQGMNIVSLILSKLPTVLLSKWSDYSFPLITEGKKSRLDILADFLQQEAVKISTTSNIHLTSNNFNRVHNTVLVTTDSQDFKCLYCRVSKHKLTECKRFKKSLRKDRWRHVKRHGICYKCLLSRHDRETCPSAPCDIDNCGQSHHRLLHYSIAKDIRSPGNIYITEMPESETVTNINLSNCKVLLKTVPINIHGPNGVISATALLDDGSTVSLIDYELTKKLGLIGYKQVMRVSGAWNNNSLECVCEIMDLNVSNKDGTIFPIRVRSVKDLNLPVHNSTSLDLTSYEHSIPEIKKCLSSEIRKPKILIGQDNYDLLLPLQIIKLKNSKLYITRTELGLCIHGSTSREPSALNLAPPTKRVLHSSLLITNDSDTENQHTLRNLEEQIRTSFTIESMGISMKPRQHPEDLQAIQYLENTSVLKNGRWHVGLPWKDSNCKMPNSYPNAALRLKGVEKRLKKDKDYARRYTERINHLLKNDYAKILTCQEHTSKTWYLPHFGVDNPNKKKLRLVFDAAAKTCGVSLNDYLLKGPDLLMSLFGIMLRFREHKIGITGDIRDMFLRIKILPKDQDALRFLWRDTQEQNGPINTYAMTSLIFGANCSPFIAQFIKNKNAKQYESLYPAAVNAIHQQHYMDDYIDSIENEVSAVKTIQDIIHIHKKGGFEIRNITSNCEAVLNCIPQETLGTSAVRFKIKQPSEGERTLGLIWYPKEDLLSFDVSFKKIPVDIITGDTRPSKRQMLKVLMSIFDIFGFLSPFTIKGKIMLQEIWRLRLDWDEKIPDTIYEKWIKWLQLLKEINQLRIPRHYITAARVNETEHHCTSDANAHTSPERPPMPVCLSESVAPNATSCYSNLQLHLFSDASTKAMSAVAYWRWTEHNYCYVTFVASKCKVAPLKHHSIPRMELQAALLAARLADSLCKEFKNKPHKRYFWCDSTTVLNWIRNKMRTYTTFVAHRLGEIDELSKSNEWRYVPTSLNVADIATKEDCDLMVLKKEWFHGPAFLRYRDTEWPVDIPLPEMPHLDLEYALTMQTYNRPLPAVPDPERFSSWLRLLNSTCNVLTFIIKCKKQKICDDGYNIREAAERWLIKYSQLQSFSEDITNLENKKEIDKKSRLLTLSPFLNEHGILCVGGRINAAPDVPLHLKQPVILDGRDRVARLIVRHYHVRAAHGYNEAVVNNLKQKYYILKLRPTVRSVASQCMFCRIRKAQPCPPRMGDLPAARLASRCRPFTHCGIDLFGPMEITVIRRREKRYGVLFTCLTVRAIHIELVPSLTTDSLIMALRRMAARRGWPQFIYSDNGTNLRGADNELKKSTLDLNEKILKAEALNYGTTWTFIPPASPHWGGAWERLIRSVKNSLRVILRERAPREETLITLMAEVEQMVNSRPLTHVTVEPNSNETITPNHFLLGSSSNLPIVGAFDDSDLYLRKQWRLTQRLADMFWRRWVREVLPTMLPRQKWNRDTEPLRVGDFVLIADPEAPRNTWPKGIIQRVIPGRDGRVRLVEVKTKTSLLQRSAARVAKVPIDVEC